MVFNPFELFPLANPFDAFPEVTPKPPKPPEPINPIPLTEILKKEPPKPPPPPEPPAPPTDFAAFPTVEPTPPPEPPSPPPPQAPPRAWERLGLSQAEWDAYRRALQGIESSGKANPYGIMGGSSNRFAGAYQMGKDEIRETAEFLGEPTPSREQFLNDPDLQERFLDGYTQIHDDYLTRMAPGYAEMSPREKLRVLGYAHNQGRGGASNFLATGAEGRDAFGTPGTKYMGAVDRELQSLDQTLDAELHGVDYDPNAPSFGAVGAGAEPDMVAELFNLPESERRAYLEQKIHELLGVPLDLRAPAGTLGQGDVPTEMDMGPAAAGLPERNPLRGQPEREPGLLEPGNVDFASRPRVETEDGKIATVRSKSFNFDGKEVLLPTVSDDGRLLSDEEAVAQFKQTGKHLGIFDSPETATAFGEKLHLQEEAKLKATDEFAAFPVVKDDFSAFPPVEPEPTKQEWFTLTPEGKIAVKGAEEAGKGVARGAAGMAGVAVEGVAGAENVFAHARDRALQRHKDFLTRYPTMTAENAGEVRDFIAKINKEEDLVARYAIGDALTQLKSGKSIDEVLAPPIPIEQLPTYQAGQSIKKSAEEAFPVDKEWAGSVTVALSEGVGSLLAGIPAAMLNPAVGGLAFTSAGMGEAAENALNRAKEIDLQVEALKKSGGTPEQIAALEAKKPTPEQIATATLYGTAPGATDVVPVEFLLGSLRVPMPFRAPLARAIGRIGGQAFIEGFQEGGQRFLQNLIAKEGYNPEQPLAEGVVPEAGVGAGVGAIAQGFVEMLPGKSRGAQTQPNVQPQPAAQPSAPPQIAATAAPGTPPPPAAPAQARSPEAEKAADILRQAGWSDVYINRLGEEALIRQAEDEQIAAQAVPTEDVYKESTPGGAAGPGTTFKRDIPDEFADFPVVEAETPRPASKKPEETQGIGGPELVIEQEQGQNLPQTGTSFTRDIPDEFADFPVVEPAPAQEAPGKQGGISRTPGTQFIRDFPEAPAPTPEPDLGDADAGAAASEPPLEAAPAPLTPDSSEQPKKTAAEGLAELFGKKAGEQKPVKNSQEIAPTEPGIESSARKYAEGEAEPLQSLIDRKAPAAEIKSHPDIVAKQQRIAALPDTTSRPGYGSPQDRAARQFKIGDETITGYDNAIPRAIDKAKSYAPDGVKNEKRAVIIIGSPAAGKSTLAETYAKKIGAAIPDPDDVAQMFPEWQDGDGVNATHGESLDITHEIEADLARQGTNVVIPKTGFSVSGIRSRINRLKKLGYTVDLVNVDVDNDEAMRRMAGRYLKNNRLVEPDYMDGARERARNTYNAIRKEGIADRYAELDANKTWPYPILKDGDAVSELEGYAEAQGDGRAGPEGIREGVREPATAGIRQAAPEAGQEVTRANADIDARIAEIDEDLADPETPAGDRKILENQRADLEAIKAKNVAATKPETSADLSPENVYASREVETDDGETLTQSLTHKGPWDFNDTYPAPKPDLEKGLRDNGRWPFDEHDGADDITEQVAYTFEESLGELQAYIHDRDTTAAQIERAKAGTAKPPKRGMTVETWVKQLEEANARANRNIDDVTASYADIFGEEGSSAFREEGERRVKMELGSAPRSPEMEGTRAQQAVTGKYAAMTQRDQEEETREARLAANLRAAAKRKKLPNPELQDELVEAKYIQITKNGAPRLLRKGKESLDSWEKRTKARAAYQKKMDALPDTVADLTAEYSKTIDAYDKAIRDDDKKVLPGLRERMDMIQEKANGGTHSGVATRESPAEEVRKGAAAPVGAVPKWGQQGIFEVEVNGIPFIVRHGTYLSDAIYAKEKDTPFPSQTGYRSFTDWSFHSPPAGADVKTAWETVIRNYMATEKKLLLPQVWYRMPKDWNESDRGDPIKVGGSYGEGRGDAPAVQRGKSEPKKGAKAAPDTDAAPKTYQTPKTKFKWSNLSEWMDGAEELTQRSNKKASSVIYKAQDAHWEALPLDVAKEWIKSASETDAKRLESLLNDSHPNRPWGKKHKGARAGKWADINVEVKNRLQRLTDVSDKMLGTTSVEISEDEREQAAEQKGKGPQPLITEAAPEVSDEQKKLAARVAKLIEEIEPLDANFAAGMRGAHNGALRGKMPLKPSAITFYEERLETLRARAGETGLPAETITFDDIIKDDDLTTAQLAEIRADEKSAAGRLIATGEDVIAELVNGINQRGFKVRDVNTSSAPRDVVVLKNKLTGLAGTLARVVKQQTAISKNWKRADAEKLAEAIRSARMAMQEARDALKGAPETGPSESKAPEWASSKLAKYTGTIDGYQEDDGGRDEAYGKVKRDFHQDARNYLTRVSKLLAERGFKPHIDKKGKPLKAVRVNKAGPASSGEVSLSMINDAGDAFYVQIQGAVTGPGGIDIRAIRASKKAPYGENREPNQWQPVDMTVAEMADRLEGISGALAKGDVETTPEREQPKGPRVLINLVGKDGKTDAERGAKLADDMAWWNDLTAAGKADLIREAGIDQGEKTAWHNLTPSNQRSVRSTYEVRKERAVTAPKGYEVDEATRVKDPEEARIKGGAYTAVARRLSPWKAERGYGDTPEAAQRNALFRAGAEENERLKAVGLHVGQRVRVIDNMSRDRFIGTVKGWRESEPPRGVLVQQDGKDTNTIVENPGRVIPIEESEKQVPPSERGLEALKKKVAIFASGMSRIGDLGAGTWTWGGYQTRGIGVDVGELSKPGIDKLADAIIDKRAQVFVDSGAFSLFKRNLRHDTIKSLDFDKVLAGYDAIEEAIERKNEAEETDYPRPIFVMPDIVGDQAASLELVTQYKDWISTEAKFNISQPMVPIQKGALSLSEAYDQVVETLGTDNFIVGIPSNEKAVTNAELVEFLKESKPRKLHFLGTATDKKLDPKLQAIVEAGYTPEHISADANVLRGALYGRRNDEIPRGEAISEVLGSKTGDEKQGGDTHANAKRKLAAKQKKPMDAIQFIRQLGGIQDPTGELKSMGVIRGIPGLVNKNGRHPDKVREAFVEAGYLAKDPDDAPPVSSVDDVYEIIAKHMRGEKTYSAEDANAVEEMKAPEREREYEEARQRAIDAIEDHAATQPGGYKLAEGELARALELYQEGMDLDSIFEQVAVESARGADETEIEEAVDEVHPGTTREAGEGAPQGGAQQEIPGDTADGTARGRQAVQDAGKDGGSQKVSAADAVKAAIEAAKARASKAEVAKSAISHAAEGTKSAAEGLSKLFGGKKLSGGISPTWDEETWAAAKPLFIQATKEYAAAAQDVSKLATLLVDDLIAKFNMSLDALEDMQQYLTRFVEDVQSGAIVLGDKDTDAPQVKLAKSLAKLLADGKTITAKMLQDEGGKAYGAALATGKFTRKDTYDALELAVNMRIRDGGYLNIASRKDAEWKGVASNLEKLLALLPTQTVRSEDQQKFQQFSTPPHYAMAIAYVANIRNGDVVLEPTAGTGSLVAAAMGGNATIVANELAENRIPLLRELVGDRGRVFKENAEQINNILPQDVKPTVVVMNPPFSQTAGRMGDKRDINVGAQHIEQALARLQPGGRLVAIVGRGMSMEAPRFKQWWDKIRKTNTVRANIGVDGKVYAKYGTTFSNRVLVIDKVQGDTQPALDEVDNVADLMSVLEKIRGTRPASSLSVERPSAVSGGVEVVEGGKGADQPVSPAPADAGTVGPGKRGEGGVAAPGAGRPGTASGVSGGVETGGRPGVDAGKPERGESQGTGAKPSDLAQGGEQPASSGGTRPQRDLGPAEKPEPGTTDRVDLEKPAPGSQAATEAISDSLYEPYTPTKVHIKGAKPHPGPLVQSAAMAAVDPPDATYRPNIPNKLIADGELSIAQLEVVVYAGQSHEKMLKAAEGETPKRRGFFIGDGTGVGKGREIAGIMLDNWRQGRTKAVWISEKDKLMNDARRDWSGLAQDEKLIFNVRKTRSGDPVEAKKGIAFITYDTLKNGMSDQESLARGNFVRRQRVLVDGAPGVVQSVIKGKKRDPNKYKVKLDNGDIVTVEESTLRPETEGATMKTRLDQIVDWVGGADFDGVIAFDEAHNMGNATAVAGARGRKEAAQKALAGLALQERLPNARIIYVSATGATEVSNLAYASRLGLWGYGTPFADRSKFIAEVEGGGIAAMELIARDMKQLGLYTARNLSYDGVEYKRLEHTLDKTQREIYDTLAEAWQVVLKNINEALEVTGGGSDRNAKSAAYSAFWGAHQRFFNQIITSMQMPSVIKAVEADLKAGRQAVLQLTSTNEAAQERAAAKAQSAEELEDLDITPRDSIIQLVEHSFPTQQYEDYVDDEGNERTRPVTDSEGKPVQNAEAVAMRDALIERLASVRVPQGPLDLVLDHFGSDVVAEVTGRKRRFVKKPDDNGNMRRVEESRPASSNQNETDAFQDGKKKILVFSEAGGTGASYHADNTSMSKDARRAHYLVQAGWRADKAVQGFGRTHRTNQASAPIFQLVTTDLSGQKRFISSIARRLSQLGALTKGQRQAGDQGMFSARDNLESHEAEIALDMFFTDLNFGRIEGITIDEFENQTGLVLRQKDPKTGAVFGLKEELPEIQKFLNRLLSLKIDLQNRVFDEFASRLDNVIRVREESGRLDIGVETVRADKIEKMSEQTVYVMEDSGAETKHVVLKLSDKFVPVTMEKVTGSVFPLRKWVKSPKGKVYGALGIGAETEGTTGHLVERYKLVNPVTGARYVNARDVDYNEKWVTIEKPEAAELWKAEIEKAPEFVTSRMNLVTGAILPIWDRLKGNPRVVRVQTDKGERLIGRVIPNSMLEETLRALGVGIEGGKVEPADLYKALIGGGKAKLSNDWELKRALVAGEWRIELTGPSAHSEGQEVKKDGVFTEMIAYRLRYFVPNDEENGTRVLGRLTASRPVVQMGDPQPGSRALDEDEDTRFGNIQPKAQLPKIAQGDKHYTKVKNKTYVTLANEGIDFGNVTPEQAAVMGEGAKAGPIRLERGFHKGEHIGFGETHIEGQHGDLIRKAGYASPADLVVDVVRNFTEIRDDGRGRYMLVKWRNNRQSAFVVMLWEKADGVWGVVTAGIRNKPYVERKELLWERGAPDRLSAVGTPITREGQSESSVGPPGAGGKPVKFANIQPKIAMPEGLDDVASDLVDDLATNGIDLGVATESLEIMADGFANNAYDGGHPDNALNDLKFNLGIGNNEHDAVLKDYVVTIKRMVADQKEKQAKSAIDRKSNAPIPLSDAELRKMSKADLEAVYAKLHSPKTFQTKKLAYDAVIGAKAGAEALASGLKADQIEKDSSIDPEEHGWRSTAGFKDYSIVWKKGDWWVAKGMWSGGWYYGKGKGPTGQETDQSEAESFADAVEQIGNAPYIGDVHGPMHGEDGWTVYMAGTTLPKEFGAGKVADTITVWTKGKGWISLDKSTDKTFYFYGQAGGGSADYAPSFKGAERALIAKGIVDPSMEQVLQGIKATLAQDDSNKAADEKAVITAMAVKIAADLEIDDVGATIAVVEQLASDIADENIYHSPEPEGGNAYYDDNGNVLEAGTFLNEQAADWLIDNLPEVEGGISKADALDWVSKIADIVSGDPMQGTFYDEVDGGGALSWVEISKLETGAKVEFVTNHDLYPEGVIPKGTKGKVTTNNLNELSEDMWITPDTEFPFLAPWGGQIQIKLDGAPPIKHAEATMEEILASIKKIIETDEEADKKAAAPDWIADWAEKMKVEHGLGTTGKQSLAKYAEGFAANFTKLQPGQASIDNLQIGEEIAAILYHVTHPSDLAADLQNIVAKISNSLISTFDVAKSLGPWKVDENAANTFTDYFYELGSDLGFNPNEISNLQDIAYSAVPDGESSYADLLAEINKADFSVSMLDVARAIDAMGTAYAGIKAGFHKSLEDVKNAIDGDAQFPSEWNTTTAAEAVWALWESNNAAKLNVEGSVDALVDAVWSSGKLNATQTGYLRNIAKDYATNKKPTDELADLIENVVNVPHAEAKNYALAIGLAAEGELSAAKDLAIGKKIVPEGFGPGAPWVEGWIKGIVADYKLNPEQKASLTELANSWSDDVSGELTAFINGGSDKDNVAAIMEDLANDVGGDGAHHDIASSLYYMLKNQVQGKPSIPPGWAITEVNGEFSLMKPGEVFPVGKYLTYKGAATAANSMANTGTPSPSEKAKSLTTPVTLNDWANTIKDSYQLNEGQASALHDLVNKLQTKGLTLQTIQPSKLKTSMEKAGIPETVMKAVLDYFAALPKPPKPKVIIPAEQMNYEQAVAAIMLEDIAAAKDMEDRGIPMDYEAREERRKQLGYTQKAFKGVNSQIFYRSFNTKRRAGADERAAFFSDKPGIADGYTGSSFSSRIYPVWLRTKGMKEVDWHGQSYGGGNLTSELDKARDEGYPGVIIHNMQDVGGLQTQYAVFDMTAIRSTFARFDLEQPHSSNIMASLGPPGARGIIERRRARPSRRAFPRLSPNLGSAKRREIEDAVKNIARVAGQIEVQFRDVLSREEATERQDYSAIEAQGVELAETAGGYYEPRSVNGNALIVLSLNPPRAGMRTVGYHEAYHHAEMAYGTEGELRLLNSRPELERIAAEFTAKALGVSVEDALALAPHEIRAFGFQQYASERDMGVTRGGVHIAVRRVWERLYQTIRRIRNYLNGLGYQTYEDIFGAAYTGQLREGRTPLDFASDRLAMVTGERFASVPPKGVEYITEVAIRDEDTGRVWSARGVLHSELAEEAAAELMLPDDWQRDHDTFEDGFLTSTGRFVNREEAVKVAQKAKQLKGKPRDDGDSKYVQSEDLKGDVSYYGTKDPRFASIPPKPPAGFDFGPDGKLQAVIPGAERNQKQMLELKAKAPLKPKKAQEGAESLGGLFGDDKKQKDLFANIMPRGLAPATVSGARYRKVQHQLDRFRTVIQDKVLPIRRAQEAIEAETGAPLPTDHDVYVAEAIYHGRAGERLIDLEQKVIEPMLETLRAGGVNPDEFGDYLYARHAVERNEAIAEINDDLPEGGSGMEDAEAEQILAEVAADPRRAVFQDAAAVVDRMIRQTRATLLHNGLIDKETSDNWRTKYAHYVPLRGFEVNEEEEAERARTGRGFDIKGPEAYQALGRRSRADNPLAYAVMQAQQAIIRAEKNRVWEAMHRLVTTHPKPGLWKVYQGEVKRRMNPLTGMVEQYFARPPYVRDDDLFAGKIGGKTVYIEVKNPALARALRGTGNEIFGNPLTRGMQTLSRTYAALLTSYNPEFIFTNALRDVQTALINISDLANKPEGVRRKMITDLLSLKSIRGAMSAMRGEGASEYAPWFDEFRREGGKVSYIEMNDVERIKHRIETSIKQGDMRRAFRALKKVVDDTNTAVENGVRLSTYVALRKAGVEKARAAFVARELTVNFNRKGEVGPFLNSLWIFFNASAQGSIRIAQAFHKSKAVRYTVAGLFGAGFMSALVNSLLLSGDDDDGENAYDNIPTWVKERNWIVMIPGTSKYLMVPMPYGWNVPMYAGQQLFSAMRGSTTALESAANVGAAALESFNPMGTAPSLQQLLAPTLLDPFIQTQEGEGRGKTWFGGSIYPPKYNKFQPNSELVVDSPWYMQEAAQFMNQATGGNEARSGYIDVSPETIQHYAEFAFGGAGKTFLNAYQTGESIVTGKEWLPEKTPILRRLYSQQTSVSAKADFYRAWNEVDAAHYEVTQLRRDGHAEQAKASTKKYATELSAWPRMKEAHDLLSSLRSQREGVEASTTLSGNARREKIAEIVSEEKRVIAKALKGYSAATPDPRVQEMLRLGVPIGTPTDAISGQTLTTRQFEFYQHSANELSRRGLNHYMADPRWAKASDATRTKIIEKAVRDARALARKAVIARYPEIGTRMKAAKKDIPSLKDGEAEIIRNLWQGFTAQQTPEAAE